MTPSSGNLSPKPDKIGYIDFGDHRLEFVKYCRQNTDTRSLILLHEGLGSVGMWRKFPAHLTSATAAEMIAYSRRGYGSSSPREAPYAVDYMHREARETLPRLCDILNVAEPILVGHSDSASIALIHAPEQSLTVRGVAIMAPHIMIDPISIQAIKLARQQFQTSDMREKLARYHDDPASAFRGRSDIWLKLDFLKWDIRELLPNIRCPILAIQGENDPYGTMVQIDQVKTLTKSKVEVLKLGDCGHSPHREIPEETMDALKAFIGEL